MTLTTATTSGSTPQVADLYVALQLPDQTMRFLQAAGGLTPEVRPLVASWTVALFMGEPFRYIFTGGEPVGNYRWLAVFTEPGRERLSSLLPESCLPSAHRGWGDESFATRYAAG